jgi:hypothetical protein
LVAPKTSGIGGSKTVIGVKAEGEAKTAKPKVSIADGRRQKKAVERQMEKMSQFL